MVRRVPGVLDALHDAYAAHLQWRPSSTWGATRYRLSDGRQQTHVVVKAELSAALREELALRLPEETVDPQHAGERAMLASTPVLEVDGALRLALLDRGVEVWTVGWHRHADLIRVAAAGGPPRPHVLEFASGFIPSFSSAAPPERPHDVPWSGPIYDVDFVSRLLGVVAEGRFNEDDVLLARDIVRRGYKDHLEPLDARRKEQALVAEVEANLETAIADGWDGVRWTWIHPLHDELPVADPHTAAVAAALARGDAPDRVEVAGLGTFARETLPAVDIDLDSYRGDGWLPDAPGLPPPSRCHLHLPPRTRLTCPMSFDTWKARLVSGR